MVATKPSNTQVYSPFGSFVVEQHDEPGRCDAVTPHHETTRRYDTGRYDTIKRHYVDDDCRSEKGIAIIWTLLIAGCLARRGLQPARQAGPRRNLAGRSIDEWHAGQRVGPRQGA